jgi:hypothetical protein
MRLAPMSEAPRKPDAHEREPKAADQHEQQTNWRTLERAGAA